MFNKYFTAGIAALTIAAGSAQAAPFNFEATNDPSIWAQDDDGNDLYVAMNITAPGFIERVRAGAFAVTITDQNGTDDDSDDTAIGNFIAFCVDLAQNYDLPNVYDLASPIGNNASSLLQLFANNIVAAQESAVNAAAFQISVWELITEAEDGTFDVTDGLFSASGNGDVISTATAWLAGLGSANTENANLVYFSSDEVQDLVIGVNDDGNQLGDVPLPAGGLLLLGGLGALAAARRKKA